MEITTAMDSHTEMQFLQRLHVLDKARDHKKMLALLYDRMDDLLMDGEFTYCDGLLYRMLTCEYNYGLQFWVGLLTITFRFKTLLPKRGMVYSRARDMCEYTNYPVTVLSGLGQ